MSPRSTQITLEAAENTKSMQTDSYLSERPVSMNATELFSDGPQYTVYCGTAPARKPQQVMSEWMSSWPRMVSSSIDGSVMSSFHLSK